MWNRNPVARWEISVDTGGTFTDCLARDPQGEWHRAKVLSSSALRGQIREVVDERVVQVSQAWGAPRDFICGFRFQLLSQKHPALQIEEFDPEAARIRVSAPLPIGLRAGEPFEVISPEEAPVLVARLVTKTPASRPLPLMVRLGTTKATNALLEEKGARVTFFITCGFGDLLRIGTQQRPDLFALKIELPEPLYFRVIEVPERIDATGRVHLPLEPSALDHEIAAALAEGCTSAAVALMHSYRNPRHEQVLAQHLRRHGFPFVSVSSELAAAIKLLPRAETAVVDAYLAPLMQSYLGQVESVLAGGQLLVMTSAGGLVASRHYRAKDSLLSGPAGGVVGSVAAARQAGFEKIIAFDMGGTSTDVARFDGKYEYNYEHRVGRARLVAPALKIESVAAGGGSVCGFNGERLFVGPESAGASPGPACYGAGGPLTLTDVNLLLGRLDPSNFGIPLDTGAAVCASEAVQRQSSVSRETLLTGFLEIANERMANAIRKISIREGYAPEEYALVAFGGAGGQHACAVAAKLGMETIVCPADAGLLSAVGLQQAVIERFGEEQVLRPLAELLPELDRRLEDLARKALKELAGFAARQVTRRIIQLRLQGQESTLDLDYETGEDVLATFRSRYRDLYGYCPEAKPVEAFALRVVASTKPPALQTEEFAAASPVHAERFVEGFFAEAWRKIPVFNREALPAAALIIGPAIVQDRFSTAVIDHGWHATKGSRGSLLFERQQPGRF